VTGIEARSLNKLVAAATHNDIRARAAGGGCAETHKSRPTSEFSVRIFLFFLCRNEVLLRFREALTRQVIFSEFVLFFLTRI
jgi:hypothetical protein